MMRLRKLDLALFGHFTDRSIDFGARKPSGSDFHIVFGPNEAGKTTLMEGYLRLLYGFPSKDAYAFKHQRANLQVGGDLEINGKTHTLTRISTRNGNLLGASDNVIPEALLQAPLAGLSMDDYRNLLCLDDDTMEAGGEEITRSKGDIGRLLFTATGAVSNLSKVLEDVNSRTLEIYRKGGSRSEFAVLKREHDQISREIREQDISATAYKSLRNLSTQANNAEVDARKDKSALSLHKARVAAIIAAHPVALTLHAAKEALEPISRYPDALDIDPETLVEMAAERVGLVADKDSASERLATLKAKLGELVPLPEILAIEPRFEVLQGLKNRTVTAQDDLPRRRVQRDSEIAELSRLLAELGINAGDNPTRFVLTEPQLAGLERKRSALHEATKDLETAQREERSAIGDSDEVAQRFELAQNNAVAQPTLEILLARYQAHTLLGQYRHARQEIALSDRLASNKLTDLTCLGREFDAVPILAITSASAAKLTDDIVKADHLVASADAQAATMAEKLDRARVLLKHTATIPDLINDDDAAQIRQQRDLLWHKHRDALDSNTAELFEAAMLTDDDKSVLRQGQAKEIAKHRQAMLAHSEAKADHKAALAQLNIATDAAKIFQAKLAALLKGYGLAKTLSCTDFTDWVRRADDAQKAQNDLAGITHSHAAVLRSGKALHGELSVELGETGADLEALVAMAQTIVAQRVEQQRDIASATRDRDRQTATLARRRNTLGECQSVETNARAQWDAAVKSALPDEGHQTDLADALPTLRHTREINVRINAAQRQIDGMERDQSAFAEKLAEIRAVFPATNCMTPLDAFLEIEQKISEAQRIDTAINDLSGQISVEKSGHDEADAKISTLDKQVGELAAVFSKKINTGTIKDLRDAVRTGTKAIKLRETVKMSEQTILAGLNVETRQDAQAILDALPLDAATAELTGLENDIIRAETALDTAIEGRTTANIALNAVIGESDIAELVARKRTIESEMEAALLRYLEGRFSHNLADSAIRRYRDAHRSGMMAATEQAFSDLTNGAYSALRAQPGAKGEVLMATQASDQTTKQVSAMSKGTRFQLYLALRAAAYEQMAASGITLPFFCDDIFETFDDPRTRSACRLMQRVGMTGQAIYLTHHQHVVDIAREVCGEKVQVHTL